MPNTLTEHHQFPDYSRHEIQLELDQILSSKHFSRSSVLTNFLKFIVEQTLEGNTDNLKEYTIAVSALGKSEDFNPQIDAIIRIHAGRLRRLLNEYYTGPGIDSKLRIEVIKGSYVPVFRKHVSIEIEPETSTDLTSIIKPVSVKVDAPVISSRSKLTLAILPFRNLCPDNEYQFFVDGFGEELTRIFSSSEDISVVAHFSTRKYHNNFEDARVIGSDLGVHYLIMGSVKRSSTEIRVSVCLVETMNGIQIWSKDYAHNLEKDRIMEIQDQIDQDVFAILSGQYGFLVRDTMKMVEKEMKQDLQSFDAILWNYFSQQTHSIEDSMSSRRALEKALLHDPNNVMCLVVLADNYLFSYSLGYENIEDPVNEAYKLLKKAIKLAPNSQYAHMIYGWVNVYLGRKDEAIEALEFATQLGPPSSSDKGDLGFGFTCIGEYDRGLGFLNEALKLNPYCPWWYYVGFFCNYYHRKDYTKALDYAYKINVSEDVYLSPLLITAALGELGELQEAQPHVATLNEKFTDIKTNLEAILGSFLLDKSLISNIIKAVKKAGVSFP